MAVHDIMDLFYKTFILVTVLQTVVCLPVETMSIPRSPKQKVGHVHKHKQADTYNTERDRILLAEQHMTIGGDIVLTADEQKIDALLLAAKQREVNQSLNNGGPFAPAINFLLSKDQYEQSEVFKMIKKMPKGGALHTHDVSVASIDWLVKNVTYRDHCYMCTDVNNSISFKFFNNPPQNPACPWELVSNERQRASSVPDFDQMLYNSMILTKDDAPKDINTIWRRFEDVLIRVEGLVFHTPIFEDYCYQALKEFNQDNVQYLEIRSLLLPVYDLDGTEHPSDFVLDLYDKTIQRFKVDYPEFTDLRIIMSSLRIFSEDQILSEVKTAMSLIQKKPQIFAGYDLVGQEDPGKTLFSYKNALQYPSQQNPPVTLPYFFHAGETDWEGTRVDDNLIDAVLLNTTRIGHGYAITKHPELMAMVKNRFIGIEVNPISNQVLKLVDDLRNHPAATLIAENYPVVISCDDPATWGASGLSYDFYATFMALTGADDGLKVLKQLAMNSLIYSSLPQQRKVTAIQDWNNKWNSFIGDLIAENV